MLQYWWFNFQSTFLSFYMIFLLCFSSQHSIWNESQHIYCIIFVDSSYGLRCLFYLHLSLSLSLSLLYSYYVVFACVLSCAIFTFLKVTTSAEQSYSYYSGNDETDKDPQVGQRYAKNSQYRVNSESSFRCLELF